VIKNQQCQHDNQSEDYSDHNPHISIFIRFEARMKNRNEFENNLSDRANEAEAELLKKYPQEMVNPVIQKLRNLMKGIKNEAQQSVAIFVCPLSEKVTYFTYNPYLEEFNKLHPLVTLK
jgi:hypothetical protein